jgi:organic radical activating enzyme
MKDFTEDDFVLQQIDLRWSNTCNLACNYCYEYFSSIWAKILNKYLDPLKDSTDLLSYIEHNNTSIKHVNLLGGEPLLQKENHKLFELLDKNVKGYILTNLSVPIKSNKIATKIIEEFPNISWGVSFDNVGKRFEYVRHRADWDLLVYNIDYVSHKVKELNIHPLYNIYTAFNLVELYEFLEDKKINDIYWSPILSPNHFSVFDLPLKMRKKAYQEINVVLDRWGNRFETFRLLDIQKDLLIDKPIKNHNFLEYTRKLETQLHPDKKYSFAELWPDLNKRLEKF